MFGLGTKEIIIIAFLILFLFGPKKIPEITKSLVDAVREIMGSFKEAEEVSQKISKSKK